ncbi:MAG: hypothetical protein ACTSPY_18425 [Candidatus Helarchaeota archaeon]
MKIMRIFFEFNAPYSGYPLYISGNALRHALSSPFSVSFGKFIDKIPEIPSNLTYKNFFASRINNQFLFPCKIVRRSRFGKTETFMYYLPRFVTFDIIDENENDFKKILKKIKNKNLLQLGGHRNLGFGFVSFMKSYIFNLDDILDDIKELKATHAILLSPLVGIPNFFEEYKCRMDKEIFWNNGRKRTVNTIPPGQFFRLKSSVDIKSVAKSGILRDSPMGKFGFGEFYLVDWRKKNE